MNKIRKLRKKKKLKEELPSFLENLPKTEPSDETYKVNLNEDYIGPLFFEICNPTHPTHHFLKLGNFQPAQHNAVSEENLLEDFFLEPTPPKKKVPVQRRYHLVPPKEEPVCEDPFLHSCPGVKRIYKKEVIPFCVDFGITDCDIVAERVREIPLCRFRKHPCRPPQDKFYMLSPSDFRERERDFLPDNERISHFHFPKEIVTVRVVGPPIPASFCIKKLIPSQEICGGSTQDLNDKNVKEIRRTSRKSKDTVKLDKSKSEKDTQSKTSVHSSPVSEGKSDKQKFDLEVNDDLLEQEGELEVLPGEHEEGFREEEGDENEREGHEDEREDGIEYHESTHEEEL